MSPESRRGRYPSAMREPDLVEIVAACLRLAARVRHEGLLAVDGELDSLPDELLKVASERIADGATAAQIVAIVDARMAEATLRHQRELHRMRVIRDGVLGIQSGDTPTLLRVKLEAYLSPDERARLAQVPPPLPTATGAVNPPQLSQAEIAVMDFDAISLLSDDDMRRLVRELDTTDLTLALVGAPDHVRDALLGAMLPPAAEQLRQDVIALTLSAHSAMNAPGAAQAEAARQRILGIIRRLAGQDEIGRRLV